MDSLPQKRTKWVKTSTLVGKSVNLYFSLTLRTYVLLVVLVSDLLASLWSKLKRHSDMTNLQFTIIIKKTLPLSMKLILVIRSTLKLEKFDTTRFLFWVTKYLIYTVFLKLHRFWKKLSHRNAIKSSGAKYLGKKLPILEQHGFDLHGISHRPKTV